MSTLSKNLKYYRKMSGFTAREVAQRCGIPQQTYTGWETGHRQPRNLDDLDKIAEVFGITKDYLLFDRDGDTMVIEPKEKRKESDRQILLRAYDELNEAAKEKLVGYAEDLLELGKYRREK